MRNIKTVVMLSTFPVAFIACAVWIGVFVIIGIKVPDENAGLVTLLVITGLALMFPWMALVLAVVERITRKPATVDDVDEP